MVGANPPLTRSRGRGSPPDRGAPGKFREPSPPGSPELPAEDPTQAEAPPKLEEPRPSASTPPNIEEQASADLSEEERARRGKGVSRKDAPPDPSDGDFIVLTPAELKRFTRYSEQQAVR